MAMVKTRWLMTEIYTKEPPPAEVPRLLTDKEIKKRVKNLHGWKHDGNFLSKTFEFENFMDGIEFIVKVARVAEREEHHPDIHVRYTTVTLSVQTHSEGGVTDWDLKLAGSSERMLNARTPWTRRRRGPPTA